MVKEELNDFDVAVLNIATKITDQWYELGTEKFFDKLKNTPSMRRMLALFVYPTMCSITGMAQYHNRSDEERMEYDKLASQLYPGASREMQMDVIRIAIVIECMAMLTSGQNQC